MNQKAKALGRSGRIQAEDLAAIWLRQGGVCYYCPTQTALVSVSFDHVVPYKSGGDNVVGNIVACCIRCQRDKYTKTPEELAAYRALDRECRTCHAHFKPRWADVKRGYGWYCKRACSGAAGGER